ncbi:MAG TPA: TerC family protein [bacterium]
MVETVGSPAWWIGFTVIIAVMLAVDLGVVHRRPRAVGMREAVLWTVVWIASALLFNLGVAWHFGHTKGLEFLTGYLIEKSLSVDNIFVFLVIFSYFHVAPSDQHRVLFWGILGAVVMRAAFIFAGVALIARAHWIIFVFGGILIVTGVRMLREQAQHVDPERNPVIRLARRWLPIATDSPGRFLVRRPGGWAATPLLLVLVAVETTDLVFAVDSIPAIFAVTRDPFIVYTSNIFAILGLRALYFVLTGAIGRLAYLRFGLGLVLVFVGVKMLLADIVHVPIGVSLSVIAGLIGSSVAASLIARRRLPKQP